MTEPTSENEEYDRCIDCDGTGHYPTGKQCRSCAGTPGRVPKGDGEPIAKSDAVQNVNWWSGFWKFLCGDYIEVRYDPDAAYLDNELNPIKHMDHNDE